MPTRCMMEPKMMQQVRKGSRETSKAASWENFIQYYDEAYEQALSKAEKRENNNQ